MEDRVIKLNSRSDVTEAELRKRIMRALAGNYPSEEMQSRFVFLTSYLLRGNTFLEESVLHGASHWGRVHVYYMVLYSAYMDYANLVPNGFTGSVFAAFHDSQRNSEEWDQWHGEKAEQELRWNMGKPGVALGAELRRINEPDSLELACIACRVHTGVTPATFDDLVGSIGEEEKKAVAMCVDADRLDYGRLGVKVNPELLLTDVGRAMAGVVNEIIFG